MEIRKVDLPEIGESGTYPELLKSEIEERYKRVLVKLEERNFTHLIVFGDREHFSNLAYLTGGYDSRFEETLLILQKNETPILILGNEGLDYSNISLLEHKKELFQAFSLQGMPRDKKRYLSKILKESGLDNSSHIGIAGLKYYEDGEMEDPDHTFDIPHYIIQEITKLTPFEQLHNAADIFTHPESGIRTQISHHEIARFEYMNTYISNQVKKIISNMRIGITESELASYFNYRGMPFTTHGIVNFGTERVLLGLSSPRLYKQLKLGEAVNIAFGVQGANSARTGFAVSSFKDFPKERRTIIEDFYYPYFKAIKLWYESLQVGESSRVVNDKIKGILGENRFGVSLNPGHQIHLEEWINSPFRDDFDFRLQTGMALQCDIIAFPGEPFVGVHVEDTVVLADNKLRKKLQNDYPDLWKRVHTRREMIRNILGIMIGDDVIPLSNIQAVFQPFLLEPSYVITSGKK